MFILLPNSRVLGQPAQYLLVPDNAVLGIAHVPLQTVIIQSIFVCLTSLDNEPLVTTSH
jgi:hypothetical protein